MVPVPTELLKRSTTFTVQSTVCWSATPGVALAQAGMLMRAQERLRLRLEARAPRMPMVALWPSASPSTTTAFTVNAPMVAPATTLAAAFPGRRCARSR